MGLYALDDNYSLSTWYENNGAYDLSTGTDLLLDQTRYILESDNYTCQLVAFPKGIDINIPFEESFNGSVNLVPYSYILGLNGFNSNQGQFTLRIYDKGAQTDLYYGQFAWFPTVIGSMQQQFTTGGDFITVQDRDKPFGPYFFRAPWIVLPPGVLQIQVTNAIPNNIPNQQLLQMLFLVAVPKTTQTLNTRRVVTGQDQSGSGIPSIAQLMRLLGG